MIQVYNFSGSWQLFPEKGTYEWGERLKSGIYKIEAKENTKELYISSNWVTLESSAFASQYNVVADGALHPFENHEMADEVQVALIDSIT
ncbi:MAG TPA: hypothetical protein VM888_02985, partial [Chitinophagaceae bacterium]|nr:hypothetical protein [Chitinophagaceae bacterium]